MISVVSMLALSIKTIADCVHEDGDVREGFECPFRVSYAPPLNLAIQNREHYSEFLELCFFVN